MAEKESRCIETLSEFIEWAAQFNDGQSISISWSFKRLLQNRGICLSAV